MFLLMGDLPFPKQKWRGSILGCGNQGRVEGRDWEEKGGGDLGLGCKINK